VFHVRAKLALTFFLRAITGILEAVALTGFAGVEKFFVELHFQKGQYCSAFLVIAVLL